MDDGLITEAVFLNYFDDRVTNGFVEGMNRAIRLIINPPFYLATSRCRSTSRIGGTPKSFLYSRLKCESSL